MINKLLIVSLLLGILLSCSNTENEDPYVPISQQNKIYITKDTTINTIQYHNISLEVLDNVHVRFGTVTISSSEIILHEGATIGVFGSASISTTEFIFHGNNYLCSENGADIVIDDKPFQFPEGEECARLDPDLPVELLYFNSELINQNAVELTWSTATELNNEKFIVKRSTDNKVWSPIGEVQGAGNSNVKLDYSFTDNEVPNASIIYYKLKQVDFDGKSATYGPSAVSKSNVEKEVNIYPNPVPQNEKLNVISNTNGLQVKIYDTLGKEVGNYTSETNYVGVNMYYPNGMYIVEVISEGKTTTEKIIVH